MYFMCAYMCLRVRVCAKSVISVEAAMICPPLCAAVAMDSTGETHKAL